DAVFGAGGAAVGFVAQVVDLAGVRGLAAAASPFAVALGAEQDGLADAGRDVLGDPDVQGEAGAGQPRAELVSPQVGGEAAGAGQEFYCLADDGLDQGVAGAGGAARGLGGAGQQGQCLAASGQGVLRAGLGVILAVGQAAGGTVVEASEFDAQADEVVQGVVVHLTDN